jgi:hypothetical protein
LKASASTTIGAVVLIAALSLSPSAYAQVAKNQVPIGGPLAVPVALPGVAMPFPQQNALVRKYCAVCHDDTHLNGGLSLEHFDAASPDPAVAAMMVSKLKAQAMGAAGIPLPDKTTQDALLRALSAEAAGAGEWTVNQTPATHASLLSASVVEETPSAANPGEPDLYRLTLTCNLDTQEAEMQLAWAPGVPSKHQVISALVDGKALFTYKVDGSEKMFIGATGTSGTGAVILYDTNKNSAAPKTEMPLPAQTLTISNLFPDKTVVFPLSGLTQPVHQALETCFTRSNTGQHLT